MATHLITIAKASLAAGLLRPDPTSVPREEIAHFHTLLDAAVLQCSPSNVQNCKAWLLKNTIPSAARTAAFGKYLTALSGSFKETEGGTAPILSPKARPSNKRKRLHVLYLINDLLHHTKYHDSATASHTSLTSNIQPHLVNLIGSAASFEPTKNRKLHQKVGELLDVWEDHGYYTQHYINKLRETAENAGKLNGSDYTNQQDHDSGFDAAKTITGGRDAPYVMPATHGNPSTPYYDLPAGNMMPHIVPNSTTPINSQLVKPLQFLAGPADEKLANAVKSFLEDVDQMYDVSRHDEEGIVDIDEMGQPLIRDEDTGELVPSETYYGWSQAFCERMRRRRLEGPGKLDDRRGRSRSRSRSRSSSPRKRRRYSSSMSSRSRSRGRSRSNSPPRSHSRSSNARRRGRYRSRSSRFRSGSYYRSRSPSHSRSPPQNYRNLRSASPERPRSASGHRSATPPKAFPSGPALGQIPQPPPTSFPPIPDPRLALPNQQPPPPPPTLQSFPGALGTNFPIGPNGIPIPPPPPPNYTGTWPPPPPPNPPNINFSQPPPPFPAFSGFVPPPPPPQNFAYGFPPHGGPSPPNVPPGPWGNPPPQQMQQGGYGGQAFGSSPPDWQRTNGYGHRGRGRGR